MQVKIPEKTSVALSYFFYQQPRVDALDLSFLLYLTSVSSAFHISFVAHTHKPFVCPEAS